MQYLLARPAFASPLPTFGHACPLPSCAGRPGALTRFFRTRPQLFTLNLETTTTTVQLVLHSEPVLLIRFLSACPGSRSTLAAVGAQCPLASCAGRPGAYARFVRSKPQYFEQLEGGSVRLVAYGEAPAPAPSADEDARAQRGLGGVAGCALCAIPYFTSAQQRREHEGGAPHRRLRDAAAAAAAQLGVQRGGGGPAAPPLARPEHGLQLCLAPAPGAPAAAPAVTEAALEAAPRSQATLQLLLRNSGSGAWALDYALAHPASPELAIDEPLGVLVPGASISVQLRFSPEQAGSSRAHLSLHLLPLLEADGAESDRSPVLLGCALALHCRDPAEVAALAALAPTAPYRRPQRRRRFAGGEAAEPPPRERSKPGEEAFYQPPRVSLAPAAGSTDPSSAEYARLEAVLSGECVGAAARAARLGLLLLCEEHAARKDMAAFDMEGVRLRASGGATASLEVPGLAEARPSVTRDDSVLLCPTGGGGGGGGGRSGGRGGGDGTHRGTVAEVARTTLTLRLGPHALARAAAGCAFDVQFELRRGSYLLQHAALALVHRGVPDEGVAALLEAPPPRGALGGGVGEGDDAAADAVLRAAARLPAPLHIHPPLNAPQRVAVAGALHRFPGARAQPPYVVFGPPGTGKTTTLAEYVLQALAGAGAAAAPAEEGAGEALSGLSAALAQLELGASRLSARSDALEALLAPQQRQLPALVLVTAPSNSAVDGLAVRLLRAGLPPARLLRVNAFTRAEKDMPEVLRASAAALWSEEGGGGYRLPDADALSRARVVAATCSTAQRLIRTLLLKGAGSASGGGGASGGGLFSHIIVDEAGQCTDPETLCAVAGGLRRGGRVVLAGDPRQLGPVLRSNLAREHGLGVSTLERLMRCGPHAAGEGGGGGGGGGDPRRPLGYHPAYCTMLNVNYRSHPALIAVPNALFYGGALQAAGEGGGGGGGGALSLCDWPGLTAAARGAKGGFPLLVHGVRGRDLQEGASPSFFNPEEAVAAVAHIASVLAHARARGLALAPSDCGIVTPYHKQAVKIKQLLAKSPALAGVAVGSVELFQGAERAVIVVSTVRASSALLGFDAKHALGFLDNPRRFNVAVTRARALLVVVGDPAILAQDDSWSALLRYAAAHGAYRGCALPEGFGGGGGGGEGLLQRLRAQAAAAEEAEAAEVATSYDY